MPTRLAAAAAALAACLVLPSTAAHAAFPGANGAISFSSGGDIFTTVPTGGTEWTRLTTDPADDAQSAWSPDGTRVAFRSRRDGHFEVYVMNADGTGQTRLTNSTAPRGTPFSSQPGWSPDGRRIVFRSNRDGDADVWSMSADGTDVRHLVDDPGDDRYPALSPDGRHLVYRTDVDGDADIWVANADGTNQVQLTHNTTFDSAPAWSPDGRRIAFEAGPDEAAATPGTPTYGAMEIYVMNADGTGLRQLTSNAAHDEGPAWSPDGTRIAFTSERDGNSEIYTMKADGSGQTRLTNAPSLEESPDWQPLPGGDSDGDGLTDAAELARGTDRLDRDTDDDGLRDGAERRTDPRRRDTDRDGLTDGVERGVTRPVADPPGPVAGTNLARFRRDRDPRTHTSALRRDTDRDGLSDGREDRNHDGRRERGETDPRRRDTDRDGVRDGRDRAPVTPRRA